MRCFNYSFNFSSILIHTVVEFNLSSHFIIDYRHIGYCLGLLDATAALLSLSLSLTDSDHGISHRNPSVAVESHNLVLVTQHSKHCCGC